MTEYKRNDIVSFKDFKKLAIAFTVSKLLPIKSLDFDYNGGFCLLNTEDQLSILSLTERVNEVSIKLRHGQAGLSKFYGSEHVVHSSANNFLRLIDFTTKSYIRYFPGHAKEIKSLDVTSYIIASGSEDKNIHLYDPKYEVPIKIKKFPSTPLVAFHPDSIFSRSKLIFAVGYDSSIIEIFTSDNIERSTSKFEFEKVDGVDWTNLKFSPDGGKLLVTTNSSLIKIIDALSGQEIWDLKNYSNIGNQNIDACFSPNSNFVIGGSFDGLVHVWNTETGNRECRLKSFVEGSCLKVAVNPKFMNIATTTHDPNGEGSNLHLWIERE